MGGGKKTVTKDYYKADKEICGGDGIMLYHRACKFHLKKT